MHLPVESIELTAKACVASVDLRIFYFGREPLPRLGRQTGLIGVRMPPPTAELFTDFCPALQHVTAQVDIDILFPIEFIEIRIAGLQQQFPQPLPDRLGTFVEHHVEAPLQHPGAPLFLLDASV